MANIFFKSVQHKQRFLVTMEDIGKIYRGTFDAEYSAAVYILTSDSWTWKQTSDYVGQDGIDIEGMLQDISFSGGWTVLVQLAGNLFNDQQHIDPIELLRLDETNFNVALTAIQLRRYDLTVHDFLQGGVA